MAEKTWLEFILENFKAGTATQIAKHIAKVAKEKGYRPTNKNVEAKVYQILPEWTPGMSKKRHKGQLFININGIYDKYENHSVPTISLDTSKQVNTRTESGESITVETPKDKSIKHNDLVKLIKDYADAHGIDAEPEKENIDLLAKVKDKYIINEVKSYKNSIYVAVGQVQFYRYDLKDKFKLEHNDFILNIVGDFKIDDKFNGFLEELKINYINISENKNISKVFEISN